MSRIPLACALLSFALGCGDDTSSTTDVGPTGPPSIAFVDPPAQGAPTCRSIGDDVQARLPLRLTVVELVLRPPGACAGYAQCGHLELYVGEVLNNEAASSCFDLLLGKLADPIHDGSPLPGSGEPDVLDLSVRLVDDDDEPMCDHEGLALTSSAALLVVPDCHALPGAN
jgi:hypothetical protein